MRISDWSSDVCSSDLTSPVRDQAASNLICVDHSAGGTCVDFEQQPAAIFGTAELRVHNTVEREFGDNRCHEIFKRMARDDMLAARAELSAGRIFEHFPIPGETVERDLGPGEIWHNDNIADWTAQLLIAHSGEILFGTNAEACGILKRSEERRVGKECV